MGTSELSTCKGTRGGDHMSPQSHKPMSRTLQCQLPGSWLTDNMANCYLAFVSKTG